MLKLKRVELQGFKSFCDRSEMRFNGSGITAIVGPNGCGKSNLSDAISWVLGEQSAKSLRGSRMEDVIFAGTRERKPLGMAYVTMTLVDPDAASEGAAQEVKAANGHSNGHSNGNGHEHPPEHPAHEVHLPGGRREITITRRLFRSGESEYLIDGKLARLRDIQDIFMGTGLGPESYAIIEQGRIGQILSSKPQDRRSVIEEAAGVTKFKTRRRLAEAKLEGARQNLTRVFDILEEVSRQATSLKRQAAKAKRYGELRDEMLSALRKALGGRYRVLERDASKLAIELSMAVGETQRVSQEMAAKEKEHAEAQEACYRTEQELAEARKRLEELRLEAERTRGRLERQAQQIGTIEQRLGQGESEALAIEGRSAELQAEIARHAEALRSIEQVFQSSRETLTARNEERERLQGLVRERQRAIEEGRAAVLRLLGESSSLSNQQAQIDEYLAAMDRDATRARREEEAAKADLEKAGARKAELSGQLAARQLQLDTIAERRKYVEGEFAVRKDGVTKTRHSLDEQRHEMSRIKARRDSLEEILSHRAYTTESVKRLFTAIGRGQAEGLKPLGVLADFVEVDRAYEKAAEEFLHEELEYVVVENWAQAEAGIDVLRRDLDGRATFLVHPEPGTTFGHPAGSLPAVGPESGIVCRLSDALRFTNGLTHAPAELLPRLARCFVVEDRTSAHSLAAQYPDLYFLLNDGVCYQGHAASGGRKTGSGPLGLKRELRELKTQVAGLEIRIEQTANVLAQLESESAKLAAELEVLRTEQQNEEREALALDHEMRKLGEELSRSGSRLSVAQLELERLGRESERSREQRDRNRTLIEETEKARREREAAVEQVRIEMDHLEAEAARAAEAHAAIRVELASLEERRRAEAAAQQKLEAQLGDLLRRRNEIAAEMERWGVERAGLLTDNIGLDSRLAALASEIAGREAAAGELESHEIGLRASLASTDEALRLLRGVYEEAHQRKSQVEVDLVRKQAELKYLDETSRKELSAAVEEVAAAEPGEVDEIAVAEGEQRCQELRSRIEALGPVNPQALEEYQEAQQRYDFLNTQRQDLLDSIRDTEKAIHEIDAESRKRFTEAFEAVNANFRQTFQTLFGGGTGEMRLTEEGNAESGIEIVASPPGKRLQNVLLLSGGEKSLTAMALLMAIFRYQPSPFCVLDEVDAPLDEPNIQRLMRLLREMATQTQFVIITHAKRTMEAAQVMYGVTMQEPGVSKLVSVKFAQPALPPPPAVAAGASSLVS